MKAHQLDADGFILNTIVVDSLDVFPDLIDASIGGSKGDRIVNGGVVPAVLSLAELAALRQQLVTTVDDRIAEILARWLRFEAGYVAREAAARAFVAAEYLGDPGIWVTGFAEPAGLTNAAAANLIITQADGLRGALEQLEAARMLKYRILAANSAATAYAEYDSIIVRADEIARAL